MAYFWLMAGLSLNLAVVNLLPIPILDGATIFMLMVEMFMRRDLSLRVKEAAFRLGFVFLMAVIAFVIYNDISKLSRLTLRRELIGRHEHRLDIHWNAFQTAERLLHIRTDHSQLIQHLLGAA